MVTLLLDGDLTRKRVDEIRAYAEREENYHRIGGYAPGGNPEHVLEVGTVRVVFSVTKTEEGLYRHLSISNKTRYPHPTAVWYACEMFGFMYSESAKRDGSPDPSWLVHLAEEDRAIIVAQKIELLN